MSPRWMKSVYELWDALAAYPVSDTHAACDHLMRTVSTWIDADKPGWIGTVRFVRGSLARSDQLYGWRQRSVQFLDPFTDREIQLTRDVLKSPNMDWGMTSRALARRAGTFRVNRLRDGFVDLKKFRETEHYRNFYTEIGVEDRIWIGFPASEDAESFFIFDRRNRSKRFTAADAQLAGHALRGIMWFHRQLLLTHCLLVAQNPLTPTERKVLQLLLTARSEKQIAQAMTLSRSTTHDHITRIYRKYHVDGRAALMAAWLAKG
jgi:DNA-binding CsgD family transcriptional regulator